MNPLNYRQPEPTWQMLQRRYSQQPVAIPVPRVLLNQPAQLAISTGTFLAGAATVGSLLVLFGKSNKTERAVAMQVLGIAAPIALGALFQIQ
jgi:hypothetical protein